MTEIHVNGKWLVQRLTGTQRYAAEMVRAIVSADVGPLVLHVPAGAEVPDWLAENVEVRTGPRRGIVFEQLYLPRATAGRLLLNFAGPAPLFKRRQLVTMHDATPFRFPTTFRASFVIFYYLSYFLLGRCAQSLVTVSNFSAQELHDVLGIPVDRFVVAGCAADTLTDVTPTRPTIAGTDEPFYLAVGTLALHKNLPRPVTAICESGRTIVVVGASGKQQVFNVASPLPSKAIVAGRLSDAELAWLYRNARALVFPSKYEGFGIPLLEAQQLQCPVITSTAASLTEIADDSALFFDPDDVATLIAQLDRLETEPSLRGELQMLGLANAKRYSWDASARTVLRSLGLVRLPGL